MIFQFTANKTEAQSGLRQMKGIALCLIFMFFAGAGSIMAETQDGQTQRLVVWMKNGEKVFYDLEENPNTTFSATDVVITTGNMSVSYPMEQVLRYTYENITIGVESLRKNDIRVSQNGNVITFQNLVAGSTVQICSFAGVVLEKRTVNGEIFVINLESYPSGVYLLKTNDTTYKFLKL